ncbi:nucleoside triphosphate pyrophosphohydrolase [Magnetospira sp. QH-2]|uniref:nucleoside triphosphate pyrophosphohydrolase n=1 Tax=Magnetospira sp. (strain QH-2) TaxID=1288970 RepID=UPI0003E817CE|nr:nucleoside triphosphate pyrophosphohydrolase [Magnetospira sp. QH-2]CCQ73791.1 Protein mazG, nucleoside triphosphate pyrophosphohydrolase [Magnetospira sp. QH-2]
MTEQTDRLLAIMARLRDPDGGCPWDIVQTYDSIAPHTIEEAYEVADAIERRDMPHLKDELGDLLFQVAYHSQMATEEGHFTFEDVAKAISDKMVRRHPHVFGDAEIATAADQTRSWESIKAEERKAKAEQKGAFHSVLDDVTPGLPALTRALKLQKRAARVGFDWHADHDVIDKIREEVDELEAELESADKDRMRDELGDLLFSLVNMARRLEIEPESALRHANSKFIRRFQGVERQLDRLGKTPDEASLEEMDSLWNQVKSRES